MCSELHHYKGLGSNHRVVLQLFRVRALCVSQVRTVRTLFGPVESSGAGRPGDSGGAHGGVYGVAAPAESPSESEDRARRYQAWAAATARMQRR